MKTSVVVTTYNGAKYIIEQLESIKDQTVTADEVLIFDDQSTDNTVELCERFILDNNLKYWRCETNRENVGYKRNFWNGIYKASGDIIFLSDQDDVWMPNKVEVITEVMATNSEILLLSSGFSRMDQFGNLLTKRVNHRFQTRNALRNIKFCELLRFYGYMGMTMCIRKSLLNKINKVGIDYEESHDIYANFIASVHGGSFHLDKILTQRRSYDSVSVTEMSSKAKEEYDGHVLLYSIDCYENTLTRLSRIVIGDNLELINRQLKFIEVRRKYIANSNLFGWLRAVKYLCYYRSFKQYINDGLNIMRS